MVKRKKGERGGKILGHIRMIIERGSIIYVYRVIIYFLTRRIIFKNNNIDILYFLIKIFNKHL